MKTLYTILQDSKIKIKTISKCFIVLLLLSVVGCSCANKEIVKDSANNAELGKTGEKEPSTVLELESEPSTVLEEPSFDISDIYGHWVVGNVVFRDISTVAKDGQNKNIMRFEDCVGSIIEYNENTIVVNGDAYETKFKIAESGYFDSLMRRMNMLNYVHRDFVENYNLSWDSICYDVFFEPIVMDASIPNMFSHIIVLNENHILFWGAGTFFDGYRVDINNLNRNELPTPPEPADPQYLYGKWIVQYALNGDKFDRDGNEINTEQYIGYTLEYQKDFITLGDAVYNNPQYSYDVRFGLVMFEKWFPHVEDDIFLDVSYFYIQYIFIDGTRLKTFGEHVYYVNEGNILVYHDGILYRAMRG